MNTVIMVVMIILAIFFQFCLALTDAFFNKMIRERIENWEELSEFEWITVTLLFGCTFLPAGMLALVSITAAWLYLLAFCFVQWDVIFGRIVYKKWFGDTPMMKVRGKWYKIRLAYVVVLRLLIGVALLVVGLYVLSLGL